MTTKGTLAMDAYRLAQYSVSVPCFICDGGNNFDAENCRHCYAPMALGHQAAGQKTPPRMIATLGTADAGKTVYLGMLMDILSHENSLMEVFTRGAFSVSLQQTTISALATCQFPDKTPNEPERWNWVHCQIDQKKKKRRPVELIMPDLAGEALLQEIEHPGTYPVIRSFLTKCSGAIILVDGARLEAGDKDQDFWTMKMVGYLNELNSDPKKGWPVRPVALAFTKADQCETCFSNPDEYARKQARGLWQLCQQRLSQHQFFAVGVAGACGYESTVEGRLQLPLRIEPRGIVEPFAWLVDQLGR